MLESRIVEKVPPSPLSPRRVATEFLGLLDAGYALKPAGKARSSPRKLLAQGYVPRHKLELFDTTFWLTNLRYDDNLGFFVAFVLPGAPARGGPRRREIHPRIFYKDVSLVWRSATHFVHSEHENWIGKGDMKTVCMDEDEIRYAAEETTNLPLEIQTTLDVISRKVRRAIRDDHAVALILRNAPDDRLEPYNDFSAPRRRAMADPRNRINGGRPVAWFERRGDPGSLRFEPGYQPDFAAGVLEVFELKSRMYGGTVSKHRILSKNRLIQYQFLAAPKQVWIIPPQALTTEISSYGVRTVDVETDEDLCVPGYEYHFVEDADGSEELHSQIPAGHAGEQSEVDPSRADASAWLDKLPVIQEFRRSLQRRR